MLLHDCSAPRQGKDHAEDQSVSYHAACLALPWLHIEYDPPTTNRVGKFQFKIRTILVMTAVVAVFLAAFRKMPMLAMSGSLLGITLCYVVRFWVLFRSFRWPVASLLACMYFPFAWTVSWSYLSDAPPATLWMASGLPAFLFTMLVGRLIQEHSRDLAWLLMLLTSAELGIGVWVIQLGPRRFVAYLVFVLIASIFGSCILNALMRM